MSELLLAFVGGMLAGFIARSMIKSLTGFLAVICLGIAVFGMVSGKLDLTALGSLSLFGIALKNGRGHAG